MNKQPNEAKSNDDDEDNEHEDNNNYELNNNGNSIKKNETTYKIYVCSHPLPVFDVSNSVIPMLKLSK